MTTWASRYQKGKISVALNEARDDVVLGWQWHQLDHKQTICTSIQTDNHNTSSVNFYRPDALPLPNQQCQSTQGKLYNVTWLTNHHSHGRQISPIISTLTWWAAVTGLGQHWWLRQLTMALPTTTMMTMRPSTCPLMLSDCESSAADCQTATSPTLPGLKTSHHSRVITNEKLQLSVPV